MADNVSVTAGSGTTIATDDIGAGVQVQRVKTTWGPDGTANDADVATGKPLPVQLRSPTGTDLTGTAGTGSAAVLTVQGAASMTALFVQPATVPTVSMNSSSANTGLNVANAFVFDDTGPTSITENNFGFGRMSANRNQYQTIRDAAGNERGVNVTSGNALTTDLTTIAGTATATGSGVMTAGVQRVAMATDSPGIITTGTIGNGNLSATVLSVDVPANATSIAKLEDAASADGDKGVPAMFVRKATPANSSGTDGDYEFAQMSGGYLWVHDNKGLSNLAFSATFSTLTRPANTTAYTAADSISDNATAGSVTALSATISDTNDDPIFISEIMVNSTDTGLAGKKVRAYLYNSDPTASTGVGGGDNAAFANKKAGYIGSLMGWMETGFSDGTVGRLVPCFNETNFTQAGGFIVTKPTSGAKTLFIQYQAVEAFTPSANSTTIIGTARGWQGRAV